MQSGKHLYDVIQIFFLIAGACDKLLLATQANHEVLC